MDHQRLIFVNLRPNCFVEQTLVIFALICHISQDSIGPNMDLHENKWKYGVTQQLLQNNMQIVFKHYSLFISIITRDARQ